MTITRRVFLGAAALVPVVLRHHRPWHKPTPSVGVYSNIYAVAY